MRSGSFGIYILEHALLRKNGQKISFAACKTYISFYPGAEILEKFSSELTGFTIKKNALHLPYKKDLPEKMIKEILEQFFSEK